MDITIIVASTTNNHNIHYLTGQLYMCDKTDLKWIKKLIRYGCTVLIDYFVKILICDTLSRFNGDTCKAKVSCFNSTN